MRSCANAAWLAKELAHQWVQQLSTPQGVCLRGTHRPCSDLLLDFLSLSVLIETHTLSQVTLTCAGTEAQGNKHPLFRK